MLQTENFGQSKAQRQDISTKKIILLRIMRLFDPDKYREVAMMHCLSMDKDISTPANHSSNNSEYDFSKRRAYPVEVDEHTNGYFKRTDSKEFMNIAHLFITNYKREEDKSAILQRELKFLSETKEDKERRLIALRKELQREVDTQGVNLEEYTGQSIYPLLTCTLGELFDKIDELERDVNTLVKQLDEDSKIEMKVYCNLLLLYIKFEVHRRKVHKGEYKIPGDLNSYFGLESLLDHLRSSDLKPILSYSQIGNIQKFIGPEVKLYLNLNESAVGVCLVKILFSRHAMKGNEEGYFDNINSGEATKVPREKYTRFIQKEFQGEDPFELNSSCSLLDWSIQNVALISRRIQYFSWPLEHSAR